MWRTCQGLIPLPDINNELNFTDEFGDRLEKCYSGAVYDTPRDVVGRWFCARKTKSALPFFRAWTRWMRI